MPEYGGRVFKLIAQGKSGDDGNLYRYFMSSRPDANTPIEGGNAFTFEYGFRLHDDPKEISHIYPYVDDRVISVKQSNFDWDGDGFIRVVSVARRGDQVKASGENEWVTSEHPIVKEELNTSLDIRFMKRPDGAVRNNNVVFYVRNQYGELLPFYNGAHRRHPAIQAHHRGPADTTMKHGARLLLLLAAVCQLAQAPRAELPAAAHRGCRGPDRHVRARPGAGRGRALVDRHRGRRRPLRRDPREDVRQSGRAVGELHLQHPSHGGRQHLVRPQ
jgi:hypothetical protein